eukprot:TRINITY_DN5230_c0_g2_i1.p1 TRINITY_DN5230_c0_g2~~TRINITY_DN5230_c0_g2_i1.p1  ORF type:complete len:201 (-),score=64.15 TRINITY_DN5230_c0_g2_i1:51-653(-)
MLRSLVGSEMCIRDSGMFMDPQYGYAVKESPFVPVDGEMFWHIGHQKYDQNWPMVIGAETAAWRLREMHYSTLSLVHGFTKLDGVSKAELGNETIDSWMSAPLNLTLLQNSRLPISDAYTQVPHTGYEYIRDHLGYRLELQAATFPSIVSIPTGQSFACLLYTSDAADEEDSVDLGGRRIIKKKKKRKLEIVRIMDIKKK